MTALRLTVLAGVLIGARAAAADVSPKDTARATNLFEAGHKLIAAGEIDLACDSFEASFAIDPQLGSTLNLADCRERQGRLVEAYELFATAFATAARQRKPGRLRFARQRMDRLARKLVEVRLAIAAPATPGLAIEIDGNPLPRDRWTTSLRREPSTIVVDATAPGRAPFQAKLVGTAGARVVLDVPALAPLAAGAHAGPAPDRRPTSSGRPTRRLAPLVLGGAGGALALGGFALGLHARARYQDELAAPLPDLNARLDGPQREADLATAIGIAGTAAITVAVVLHLRNRQDRVLIVPTASTTSATISLTGAM